MKSKALDNAQDTQAIISRYMSSLGQTTRDRQLAKDPNYYRKIQAIGVKNRMAKKAIVRKQAKVLTTVVK